MCETYSSTTCQPRDSHRIEIWEFIHCANFTFLKFSLNKVRSEVFVPWD